MGMKIWIYEKLHWVFQNVLPHWSKWWPEPLGLLPLIIHRDLLNAKNLFPAPDDGPRPGDKIPLPDPKYRPGDGYGTDKNNPSASAEGAPIGRNCPALPKHLRNAKGDPDVQLIAQRLLARDSFKPAGDQLNVIAAAWIQMQVHDWVGHYHSKAEVELDKGMASGCPMQSFKFKETLERKDGHYDNHRTMWWDASSLYGNNEDQVKEGRTFVGGKLKVNTKHPNTLPLDKTGEVHALGDNKDSWLGVALLQELFLKEHNAVVGLVAENNPGLSDERLYGIGRNVVSALVAKIHTIDWTVELLKTYTLEIGMETNFLGLPMAFSSSLSFLPPIFRLVKKEQADNKGVPFCLTEDFAAVYRLHPMLPPGLIIGSKRDEFIPLSELVAAKGRNAIRAEPGRPLEFWDSCLFYPCGHLLPHNYPDALRNLAPTDESGRPAGESEHVDLAALDLYRDRERGIPRFNDFRRALQLKPYKTWQELTGETEKDCPLAKELETIYGPGTAGIENCDLLVGDMYEGKLRGFAISETSFIIFLLMASRRLDADPFLNEYYDEKHYTKTGLEWVEKTTSLKDLLKRHYPELAAKIPNDQSAFKPYGSPKDWKTAVDTGVIDSNILRTWENVKSQNKVFFAA